MLVPAATHSDTAVILVGNDQHILGEQLAAGYFTYSFNTTPATCLLELSRGPEPLSTGATKHRHSEFQKDSYMAHNCGCQQAISQNFPGLEFGNLHLCPSISIQQQPDNKMLSCRASSMPLLAYPPKPIS